jgi:pyridoxine 5'-phosphate synthase PdxJ
MAVKLRGAGAMMASEQTRETIVVRPRIDRRHISAEVIGWLHEALANNASFKDIAAELRRLSAGRRHTPAEALVRQSRRER